MWPLWLWFGLQGVLATENPAALPHCDPELRREQDRSQLFVSTLDGKVTALDAADGDLRWTFDTGSPLLSSSIHQLELSNNGQWMRLVPSLAGSLYRFSGDTLEPLPLSADQLLSSSYKYSDDSIVAGAKESATYGVSADSGELIYQCSVNGCINNTARIRDAANLDSNGGSVVVIRSVSQTVRAFEPRTGNEKWNFSVGQHDVILQPYVGCRLPTIESGKSSDDLLYKIIVPEGLVCAVQKSAPHNVVWKRKLDAPIVNAWRADGEKLNVIDLFGVPHIPALNNNPNKAPISPAVYIGMHHKQLYVQESVRMQALVQAQVRRYIDSSNTKEVLALPWHPLPARSVAEWDPDKTALSTISEKDIATTASVLYASEYVNGNGYYLYTEHDRKLLEDPKCITDNKSLIPGEKDDDEDVEEIDGDNDFDEFMDYVPVAKFTHLLKYWWKEVAVIAITTAIFYNYVYNRIRGRIIHREVIHTEYVVVKHVDSTPPPLQMPQTPASTSSDGNSPSSFVSRYLTDFTPVKCLGRGGFGVVFEAMNKIDECHYAIKRITLPNKKEQRQRVLREVRALAKLDHGNIVRYFNSWLEEPPLDWEDPYEKELCFGLDYTETYPKVPSISINNNNNNTNKTFSKVKFNDSKMLKSYSIDIGDDNNINKYNLNSLSRQRSYSVNDSFSIVFENNSEDKSSSFSVVSVNDSVDQSSSHHLKDMFYISKSGFDDVDGGGNNEKHIENQTCEIVDESDKKAAAKGKHRRNLSLDLNKIKLNDATQHPREKVYLYIQMQLCQEKSLREWLKENVDAEVRRRQFVNMFEQIVYAVEYVHLRRLIHRDLKPSNIFFSADGQIKIGDFGLVTTMADPLCNDTFKHPGADTGNDKFTQHVGTLLYMSPEQLRGEAHNFKVDIWSLGLVLVELLVPFSTDMEKIKVLQELRENRYPKDFCAKFPDEYVLLQQMLSPEPSKRPTTLGVRAHPPLSHETDSRYHYCLPPATSLSRSSTSSVSI